MKLPRQLQRKLLNLSLTVQELVCDIVLAVEGLDPEPQRTAQTEYQSAEKNKRATVLIAERLKEFLGNMPADDIAIAAAADAGRSTREIANFFHMEQLYVRRRLCAVKKVAMDAAMQKHGTAQAEGDGAQILEIFSEAQRK